MRSSVSIASMSRPIGNSACRGPSPPRPILAIAERSELVQPRISANTITAASSANPAGDAEQGERHVELRLVRAPLDEGEVVQHQQGAAAFLLGERKHGDADRPRALLRCSNSSALGGRWQDISPPSASRSSRRAAVRRGRNSRARAAVRPRRAARKRGRASVAGFAARPA